jgi:flagellar hook assembly protein FlgD
LRTIESSYPNPFNCSTTIIYAVANLGPILAQINIDIYDIQGREVRTLLDDRKEVGRRSTIWNGKDDLGFEMTSGIYFAKIT